jgi:hypothetical protein
MKRTHGRDGEALLGSSGRLAEGRPVTECYEAARHAEDGKTIECLTQRLGPEKNYCPAMLGE